MPLDEATGRQTPRPWLESFERDPARTFDTMIRGATFMAGLVDPVIYLPGVFGRMAVDAPLFVKLDHEMLAWLERHRRKPLEDRRRPGLRTYYSRAVHALEVVRVLELPDTLLNLRDHYGDYLTWCSGEPISSALDPLARLWLALTAGQRDEHFRFLWHRLCRLSGEGRYPRHYLDIALMGLSRLPLADGAPAVLGEEIRGLAAWATSLPGHHQSERDARHDFLNEARAFRWRYRELNPEPLRSLIEPVIRSETYRDRPFARWWAEEVHIALDKRPMGVTRRPPPLEAVTNVIAGIRRDGVGRHVAEIKRLIKERLDWAKTTGESDFLVKTAGNLGGRVIREAPDLTRELAVTALAWAPNNEVLWNLWGRSLRALGQLELAEAVFWESVRRFPDDEPSHVELARLLLARGDRQDEAEAVLRDAVRRFPDNEPSHVELARLLAARGDRAAAIALLQAFLRRHPNQAVALNVLGLIYVNDSQPEAADEILERLRGLNDGMGVAELSAALARVQAGEDVAMPAPDYGVGSIGGGGGGEKLGGQGYDLLLTDARITRDDFVLSEPAARWLPDERRDAAAADLCALLDDEQPTHAYGWLVRFDRLGAAVSEDTRATVLANFSCTYVLRLMDALARRDPTALTQLMADESESERSAITALALASLGMATREQCETAAKWLAARAPAVGDRVAHYLHGAVRALLSGADAAEYVGVLESGRASAEIGEALRRAMRQADTDERLPLAA